jgi:hypothetical protein
MGAGKFFQKRKVIFFLPFGGRYLTQVFHHKKPIIMRTSLLCSLLFVASNLLAQDLPKDLTKGRIILNNGSTVKFIGIQFGDTMHMYDRGWYYGWEKIAAKNIRIVQKQTGTRAGRGALIGGIIGGLTYGSFGAIIASFSDAPGIVVGMTLLGVASGGGLGAAIGSAVKKYETVYTNPALGESNRVDKYRIGLTNSGQTGIGLGLTVQLD